IIWYHNDIPLKDSRDVTLKFDGQLCTLYKDRCSLDDIGSYRINAVNSSGQAESSCKVTITSAHDSFRETRLLSARSLPVFTELLKDQIFTEGEKIIMSVRLTGQPKPQVFWYKDNQPLRNTHDHKIRNQDDIYTLEIPELFLDDAGIYSVKAINTEGEAKSFASLNILPTSHHQQSPFQSSSTRTTNIGVQQIGTSEQQGTPPEFLQLFTDTETKLNSSITFEATVIGNPKPNVTWLFNGLPIYTTRYQQKVINNTYTLTVYDVRQEDAGRFSLIAENSLGKATCTAELFIRNVIWKRSEEQQDMSRKRRATVDQDFLTEQHLKEHTTFSDNTRQGRIYDDLLADRQHTQVSTRALEDYSEIVHQSFNKRYRPLGYIVRSIEEQQNQQRARSLSQGESRRSSTATTKDYLQRYPSIELVIPYDVLDKQQTYENKKHYHETERQQQHGQKRSATTYDYSTATSDQHDYSDSDQYFRTIHELANEYEQSKKKKAMGSGDGSTKTKKTYTTINRGTGKKTTVEEEEEYESVEETYQLPQAAPKVDETMQRSTYRMSSSKPAVITAETGTMTASNQNYHQFQQQFQDNFIVQPTVSQHYSNEQQHQQQQQRISQQQIQDNFIVQPTVSQYYSNEQQHQQQQQQRISHQQFQDNFIVQPTVSQHYSNEQQHQQQQQQQRISQQQFQDNFIVQPTISRHYYNEQQQQQHQRISQQSRSYSEEVLYRRLIPTAHQYVSTSATTSEAGFATTSEDDFEQRERRRLHQSRTKERLKPIRIASTSSIPGETEVKYVRTEPQAVQLIFPKPVLITNQGEHSSTIIKEVQRRRSESRQCLVQRTTEIEGEHETKVIKEPITAGQPRTVEFTIPKPLPSAEHSSTVVVESKKGGKYQALDISSSMYRENIVMPGEHELRYVSQPVSSQHKPVEILFPKPPTQPVHSSTVVKHTKTQPSAVFVDNMQTVIKGEHELKYIDHLVGKGVAGSVELVVPKSIMDTGEHQSTIVTETHPKRQVLEVTGSGRTMEAEHDLRYVRDSVRVEEALELLLPKQHVEQAEHSATIVRHSRGRGPIIEVTPRQPIYGEHETKIIEEAIETRADEMQLLVAKPVSQAEHSTTVVKEQRGKPQIYSLGPSKPLPGEHEMKIIDQPVEAMGELQVVFPKQQPEAEHQSTLIKQVQARNITVDNQYREIPGEHLLTVIESKSERAATESEVEFIVPKPVSGITHIEEHSTTVVKSIGGDRQFGRSRRISSSTGRSSDYGEEYFDENMDVKRRLYMQETEDAGHTSAGEHSTTYVRRARAKFEPVDLVIDRPKIQPSVSKVIADIQGPAQVTHIRPTQIIQQEDSSVKLTMDLSKQEEQYDEMEVILEKPKIKDSSSKVLANIQSGLELKSIRSTGALDQLQTIESSSSLTMQVKREEEEEETMELRIAKPRIQDSSSVLIANIQPELGVQGRLIASSLQQEDSSTAIVMDLARQQEHAPFDLIIPKFDVEKSSTTVVAQVAPTLAGMKTTINVPQPESSSSLFLEQRSTPDEPVDLIFPKPKIESSSTTVVADVYAKLETKSMRATEVIPETSTSTFYFDKNIQEVPEAVEIRLKQPEIQDSSTTVLAHVKATLDTRHVQMLGKHEKQEDSSTTFVLDTLKNKDEHEPVELILPRPRVQESTSIVLADIKPSLDTQLIIAPQPLVKKSTSQLILEDTTASEPEPVELILKRQHSSHTVVTKLDDARKKTKEMYVLGTAPALQQSGYVRESSSTLYADLNKPMQLILDVDENEAKKSRHMSYDERRQFDASREYSSRMLAESSSGGGLMTTDNSSTFITEIEPKYYEPVEFVVSGGGSATEIDQYGARGEMTSSTKRTTTTSYDTSVIDGQDHAPYFVVSLRDYSVKEGEPILFEVMISAQPLAEILWDKDGELIGDESSFRIDYYGDGRATLYIPEAFLDDAGSYSCTARNISGTVRSTARLQVESSGEQSPTRNVVNETSFEYQTSVPSYQTLSASQYHIYSQQPEPTTVTRVEEETSVIEILPNQPNVTQRYEQNQIVRNITGDQPQYQPVTFQINLDNQQQQQQQQHFYGQASAATHYGQNESKEFKRTDTVGGSRQPQRIEPNQENVAPPENPFMGPDPFKKFGARRQQRPTAGIIPQQSPFEAQQNLYAPMGTQSGPSSYDQRQQTTTTSLSQKTPMPAQQLREPIRASSSQHQQSAYDTASSAEHPTSPSYTPKFTTVREQM
ncbi:unnamed protein product, partial [Didymodactylos carnosus]